MDLKNILFMRATGKPIPGATPEEILWAKKLSKDAGKEKTIDFSPVISVSDAFAKPALELITKITAVQAGSGDPSPVNIRDISGWSDGEITRAGKNLFQTTASSTEMAGVTYTVNEDGTVSVSGTASGFSSLIVGEADISGIRGKITVSGIATATNIQWSNIRLFDINNTVVYETLSLTDPSVTIDLANYPTAVKIVPIVKRRNNVATSGVIKPMVEIGDTAHDFMPYEIPTVYSISWSEAGIVYGATRNVTTGEMVVDKIGIVYDGSNDENWGAVNLPNNVFGVSGLTEYDSADMCDSYKMIPRGSSSGLEDLECRLANSRATFMVRNTNYSTVRSFRDALALSPITVVYTLLEPIVYNFDPIEVPLLAGDNTIWSTTGDVSMKYLAKR